MLKGIVASEGYGIGKVLIVKEQNLEYTPRTNCNVKTELERYHKAVERFEEKTQMMAERIKLSVGEKESGILIGHILMMKDPYMNSEIEKQINSGKCAESSVESVCDMFIMVFSSADDELTNQRASDVKDIKSEMLSILLDTESVDISAAPPETVLVANDLTPSMTAGINKDNIVGIVTQVGGKTSHSAILARAMGIPAVLSVPSALESLTDDQCVVVDGTNGVVITNPSSNEVEEYLKKNELYVKEKKALSKMIGQETITLDGVKCELACNIGKPDEAAKVLECDGEGIGLFRTEFLFMDRINTPSEEEQFEAYKKVALTMNGKPVIIRTLDVGGDKDIPYLNLKKEENPFLGFRAVRYCLKNRDLYETQLRALLRASAYGNIKIMVPLVSCVDELRSVKEIIHIITKEFDKDGVGYKKDIKVGVMIETPAASLIADILAEESDFFSIGTNDLVQYTMSVDRGNADVSYLYSVYNPAVLRSIKRVIECAKKAGIPVGMCGEAAADKNLIPVLVSFGLDEFSVSPTSVLSVRKTIREISKPSADEIAEKVMNLKTEAEVAETLIENKK